MIYVDNKTYVAFLQKEEGERERIRKEAQKLIVEEVGYVDEDGWQRLKVDILSTRGIIVQLPFCFKSSKSAKG